MKSSILDRFLLVLIFSIASMLMPLSVTAETSNSKIGFVLMHGKGGSPQKYISGLAGPLQQQGFLVENLDMSWSRKRHYDVTVQVAESEVDAALRSLRKRGAQKVFVAGHSQGGLFALYLGNRHTVDGVIAIAPGGNVGNALFRDKLGEYVKLARVRVDEGKGDEKTELFDFEGRKGTYPVLTTPVIYLSWFDPDGAMNQQKAVQGMNPATPVLFIAPTNDYPALLKIKRQMFEALPGNPRSKLYEPNSSHTDAPSASVDEIINWTRAIADVR